MNKTIKTNRSLDRTSDYQIHFGKLISRIKELELENSELKSHNKKLLKLDENSSILSTGNFMKIKI